MTPRRAISRAGLVGVVGWAGPGELILAYRGVLFPDELPEFGHPVLEAMRQPLEDGIVSRGRARGWAGWEPCGGRPDCPAGGSPARCVTLPGVRRALQRFLDPPCRLHCPACRRYLSGYT